MFRQILFITILFVVIVENFVGCCLITNCPRGGKRAGKIGGNIETSVKPCVSCGPGHSGQCFGPNICCGPFGCLIGSIPETSRCLREGFFHEREPCIAGNAYCRKNTGRCATDGICCTQDACYVDKNCLNDDKTRTLQDTFLPLDLYNLVQNSNNNNYPNNLLEY